VVCWVIVLQKLASWLSFFSLLTFASGCLANKRSFFVGFDGQQEGVFCVFDALFGGATERVNQPVAYRG
jgi:hypothetical protein